MQSVLILHKLEDGSFVKNIPLDMGSITGYSGRKKDTEIFYSFTSFLTPGIIYHCDMTEEEISPSVSRAYLQRSYVELLCGKRGSLGMRYRLHNEALVAVIYTIEGRRL